ncbi:MAG: hypothetical protein P4L79_03690 [Legionella sp.]|uniref:hypothetical protein n=1 Tax=Legionella sp. TaxID=459 RepID=UPI00284388C7|nr:hypothetical protein [Legionella sp.]
MSSVLGIKAFPEEYPKDVVNVIESMAFNRGAGLAVLGSSSLKSMQFSQDYDLYQTVQMDKATDEEAITYLVAEFKAVIRNLMKHNKAYIGNIKCGTIEEWEVIPASAKIIDGKVQGTNFLQAGQKLKELHSKNIITNSEYNECKKLMVTNPTPVQFLEMKDNIKFNVVRWEPQDIMNGYVDYRGRRVNLRDAMQSKSLTKVDVVAFVDKNRYCDFSCIYDFKNKDNRLNGLPTDTQYSLKCDLLLLMAQGKYYKATKRIFSLARARNNIFLLEKLLPILNNEQIGSLYVIVGDIGTLLWILENEDNIPKDRMAYEIDHFKERLSNIYHLQGFVKKEHDIFAIIDRLAHPKGAVERHKMEHDLANLSVILSNILNNATKSELKKIELFPLPTNFKP